MITFTTGSTAGNATESLRIQSNGNVGIGTDNAGAPLHIESHSAGLSIRRNGQYLLFDANSGNGGDQSISSSAGFRVQTGGVGNSYERFRIHSDGDVSIGSVVGDHRLTVRKDSSVTNFVADNDPAEASGMVLQNYSFSVGRYTSLSFHACNSSTVQVASILGVSVATGTAADLRFTVRDSQTSTAEVMRMSGYEKAFMVGTTNHRTAEFSHPDGFSIRGDTSKGQFQNTVTSVMGGLMNRDGSDGAILGFRREGAGVGHIGVNASTMYLNFGGTTAAAHQLDDYQEGSWTPVVLGWDTFSPYSGSSYYAGWYVKVGGIVHVGWKIYIQNLTTVSSNAHIRISGLPFAAKSIHAGPVGHTRFDIPEFGNTGYPLTYLGGGATTLSMYKHTSSASALVAINATANRSNIWTMGTATYATDS